MRLAIRIGGAMPTLVVGMKESLNHSNMPTASVGMAPYRAPRKMSFRLTHELKEVA